MDTLLRGTAEEFSATGVLQTLFASMKGKRLAVHIYEDEEMDETEFLLRDPVNRERLLSSIEAVKRGEGLTEFTVEELQEMYKIHEK
jgi:hypothetical protein